MSPLENLDLLLWQVYALRKLIVVIGQRKVVLDKSCHNKRGVRLLMYSPTAMMKYVYGHTFGGD